MHALTERANGFVEMAYCSDAETPWHSLGNQVTRGAPIETWVVQAGMDYVIQEADSEYTYKAKVAGKEFMCRGKVPAKKTLYRSDSYAPLAIVGSDFKVVQPVEILEFFRTLTEGAGFSIETAGTLFGGRRFWALARVDADCEIVPGDQIGAYLLLVTACDGSLQTIGKFTTIRVVCHNTLSMSLNGVGEFKISHRSLFKPDQMKAKLGLAHETFSQFTDNMRRLSDKSVSAARAERLTFELLNDPVKFEAADDKAKIITKVSNSAQFKAILAMFDGGGMGANIDGVKGTAWGWVNGVTEFVDHVGTARSDDNRLNSAWFGSGDDLKNKAVALALAF